VIINCNSSSVIKMPKKTRMQEGVVVFLDALGVKGIWQELNLRVVIRSWEDFLKRLH